MFLSRKKHLQELGRKEILIQTSKNKLAAKVDSDLEKLDRLNKILGNGIALYLTTALGHHD